MRNDRFKIQAIYEKADGNELPVAIEFRFYAGRRQTYWEPGEEPYCIFLGVEFEYTPLTTDPREMRMITELLEEWGDCWVDQHQAECLEVVNDYENAQREMAADYRGERS